MSENSIKIFGVGQVGPGQYDKVKINGTAQFTGDIQAEQIQINGTAETKSNLQAEKVEVNGSFHCANLDCEKLMVRGMMHASGEINCEKIEVYGSFQADTLNAEQVDFSLGGITNIREVVGARVEIRDRLMPAFAVAAFGPTLSRFKATLVEADDIYIENTEADVVSGNRVVIGRGCKIGRVEYRETLKVTEGSSVEQVVREP